MVVVVRRSGGKAVVPLPEHDQPALLLRVHDGGHGRAVRVATAAAATPSALLPVLPWYRLAPPTPPYRVLPVPSSGRVVVVVVAPLATCECSSVEAVWPWMAGTELQPRSTCTVARSTSVS